MSVEKTMSEEVFSLMAAKPEGKTLRKYGQEAKTKSGASIGKAIFKDMRHASEELYLIRTGGFSESLAPIDMSFADYAKDRWGVSTLYGVLNLAGLDANKLTIDKLYNLPDMGDSRYFVPEYFTEAMRTGLNKPAQFLDFIRDTITVNALKITVPVIHQADASMKKIGEGESVPFGTIKIGGKDGVVHKIGRGFRFSDEVLRFSSLSMVQPFLEDIGKRLNMSQNAYSIQELLKDIVVVGVDQVGKFKYRDFVYGHATFEDIERSATTSIANRRTYTDVMDMDEVKGLVGSNQLLKINSDIKTLSNNSMRINSNIPNDMIVFLDKMFAQRRIVAQPLLVENDRIVAKQLNEVVATMMVGFVNLFDDARFAINKSLDIATNDFPTWYQPDMIEAETF